MSFFSVVLMQFILLVLVSVKAVNGVVKYAEMLFKFYPYTGNCLYIFTTNTHQTVSTSLSFLFFLQYDRITSVLLDTLIFICIICANSFLFVIVSSSLVEFSCFPYPIATLFYIKLNIKLSFTLFFYD